MIPVLTERDIKRFWNKVEIKTADECWPYLKYLDKDGYGNFYLTVSKGKGKTFRANRIALYIHTGYFGDMAIHSCDNPKCCNPNHLSWGSALENMLDKCVKGRWNGNFIQKGADTSNSKLTESIVLEIRNKHKNGGITISKLGQEYGVSAACVSYIVNRKTWTHI